MKVIPLLPLRSTFDHLPGGEGPRRLDFGRFYAFPVADDDTAIRFEGSTQPSVISKIENRADLDAIIVRFKDTDYLDENNTTKMDLGNYILGRAKALRRNKIILILNNVKTVTSGGLGNLITLNKNTRTAGIKLILSGNKSLIEEIKATQLDRFFTVVESEEAALQL